MAYNRNLSQNWRKKNDAQKKRYDLTFIGMDAKERHDRTLYCTQSDSEIIIFKKNLNSTLIQGRIRPWLIEYKKK